MTIETSIQERKRNPMMIEESATLALLMVAAGVEAIMLGMVSYTYMDAAIYGMIMIFFGLFVFIGHCMSCTYDPCKMSRKKYDHTGFKVMALIIFAIKGLILYLMVYGEHCNFGACVS